MSENNEIQMDPIQNGGSTEVKGSSTESSSVKSPSIKSTKESQFNLDVKEFLKTYKYEILLGIIIVGSIIFKLWNEKNNIMKYFKTNNNNKIDLVYTWVDGSDKNWLEKKNKYSSNRLKIDDNTRFTNIDELKYSLRSVNEYADWVNNIYIVVDDNQQPDWLNLNHPRIHLIKHSQIFKNKEDLPTFNSHSIESNLHNIPGLSEIYLYLNDDVFFGNHTKINNFISENGKLIYYPNSHNCRFELDKISESKYNGYYHAWNKTQNLLYNKLNIKQSSCQWHFGIILKKSHFTEAKNIFSEEFKNTSKSRFRNKTDIVPNGIAYQYGLNKGDYEIKKPLTCILVDARYHPKYIDNVLKNIYNYKPKMFCINNVTQYNPNIIKFLNAYFPNKSPYEI